MKANPYVPLYLSIFFFLITSIYDPINARHLISSNLIFEVGHFDRDLALKERDLIFETSPSRFTGSEGFTEFNLKKYDGWSPLYSQQNFLFRPASFSSGLFVYGNEFIDVGDGFPGQMGNYLPSYRKMFFLKVGKNILLFLVDWFMDNSTRSNNYTLSCYSSYSWVDQAQVCLIPAPRVVRVPRSCIIPLNGPIDPGNGGSPVFVDPKTPKPPKPRVLEPRSIPDPIDGDEFLVPTHARVKTELKEIIKKPKRDYENSFKRIRDFESRSESVPKTRKPNIKNQSSDVEVSPGMSQPTSLKKGRPEKANVTSYTKPKTVTKGSNPTKSRYSVTKPTRPSTPKPTYTKSSYSKPNPKARPVSRPKPKAKPVARPVSRPRPAPKPVVRPTSRPKTTSKSKGRIGK